MVDAVMNKSRLFLAVARTEAQIYVFYPLEFVVAFINRGLAIFLSALFWVVAAEFGDNALLDRRFLLGYFLIVSGMTQISFANVNVASHLLRRIKSGAISSDLLKPIDPFALQYARSYGSQVQFLLISSVLTVVGVLYASDGFSPLLAVWAVLNMIIINYSLNRMTALIGFYVVEAAGIKNSLLHVLRLLQGMLIPLNLLPLVAQDVLFFTPFPSSLYMPIATLLGADIAISNYAIGTLWGLSLLPISAWQWKRATRKYEAVGL